MILITTNILNYGEGLKEILFLRQHIRRGEMLSPVNRKIRILFIFTSIKNCTSLSAIKRKYTSKQIYALANAIAFDEEAFKWLLQSGCKELNAVCSFIAFKELDAADWLKKMGFDELYMFAVAFEEEFQPSVDFLLQKKCLELAAVLDACRDNITALAWLEKKHPAYAALALAILKEKRRRGLRYGRPV